MERNVQGPRHGWQYFFRLVAFAFVSFIVLGYLAQAVPWVVGFTTPARSNLCCQTPSDYGHPYEEVRFTGGDGMTLRGWWIPSKNGAAIILLHGYGSNRTQMLSRADILAGEGYGVLLYDLRAHGRSEGEYRTLGWADIRDVPGALEFVRSQPDVAEDKIGILGFSVGGQIALRAAAQFPEIDAVVAEEPAYVHTGDFPPTRGAHERSGAFVYRLDLPLIMLRTGERIPLGLIAVLPELATQPVLYLSSGHEDGFGHRLVANFHQHTQNSSLWNVPEANHGTIPRDRPEEYKKRITEFLNINVR